MTQRFIIISALLLCFAGCSKSGLDGVYPVSGTLTVDGQPVVKVFVTFIPLEEITEANRGRVRGGTGMTDANGKFTVTTLKSGDGLFPGEYKVTLSKRIPDKKYSAEQVAQWEAGKTKLELVESMPTKAASPKTTDLTYTAKAGKNEPAVFEVTK